MKKINSKKELQHGNTTTMLEKECKKQQKINKQRKRKRHEGKQAHKLNHINRKDGQRKAGWSRVLRQSHIGNQVLFRELKRSAWS